MGVSRENAGCLDSGTNFADILSNVLPQPHSLDKNKEKSSDSSVSVTLISLFSFLLEVHCIACITVFVFFRMEAVKYQNALQRRQ